MVEPIRIFPTATISQYALARKAESDDQRDADRPTKLALDIRRYSTN